MVLRRCALSTTLGPLLAAFASNYHLLVLLVTAGAAFFQHKRAGRGFLPTPTALGATPERLSKIYALMPAFLAVHIAVPLLINGVHTQLFSPRGCFGIGSPVSPRGVIGTGKAFSDEVTACEVDEGFT